MQAIADGILIGARLRRESLRRGALPLLDVPPLLEAGYRRPVHLLPLVDILEGVSSGGRFRGSFHAPVRHFKSETVYAWIARDMIRFPRLRTAYLTFNADKAGSRSLRIQEFYQTLGGRLGKVQRSDEWWTPLGGRLLAGGPGTGILGEGFHRIIIDDPFKDVAEARSKAIRQARWEWITRTARTRLNAQASFLLMMARLDEDDPVGRLTRDWKWPYVRLPALAEAGDLLGRDVDVPLLPDIFPWDELNSIRLLDAFLFASQYQGRPIREGLRLFGDWHSYTALPTEGIISWGMDCGYTSKESSNLSVLVKVLSTRLHDGMWKHYILDVLSDSVRAPEWVERVKARRRSSGGRIYWRFAGTETGVADFISDDLGLPIERLPMLGDKRVNAQRSSRAWNEGRILLPDEDLIWRNPFATAVTNFSGDGSRNSDYVDALGAVIDGVELESSDHGI